MGKIAENHNDMCAENARMLQDLFLGIRKFFNKLMNKETKKEEVEIITQDQLNEKVSVVLKNLYETQQEQDSELWKFERSEVGLLVAKKGKKGSYGVHLFFWEKETGKLTIHPYGGDFINDFIAEFC